MQPFKSIFLICVFDYFSHPYWCSNTMINWYGCFPSLFSDSSNTLEAEVRVLFNDRCSMFLFGMVVMAGYHEHGLWYQPTSNVNPYILQWHSQFCNYMFFLCLNVIFFFTHRVSLESGMHSDHDIGATSILIKLLVSWCFFSTRVFCCLIFPNPVPMPCPPRRVVARPRPPRTLIPPLAAVMHHRLRPRRSCTLPHRFSSLIHTLNSNGGCPLLLRSEAKNRYSNKFLSWAIETQQLRAEVRVRFFLWFFSPAHFSRIHSVVEVVNVIFLCQPDL